MMKIFAEETDGQMNRQTRGITTTLRVEIYKDDAKR